MKTAMAKWLRRAAFLLIAIILIAGVRRSLFWQDLTAMFNRPKGMTVYVR